MLRKKNLLLWILAGLLFSTASRALVTNSAKEDSLQKTLSSTTGVKQRIQIYLSLAEILKGRSTDSCILYLDKAQKMFWQINSFPYLGQTYRLRGDISRMKNKFNDATRQYKIAAFCYGKQGDKKEQMRLLNLIGGQYALIGDVSAAWIYYLKAREIAEEVKDQDMLAKINNNFGRIYIASKDFRTGIDYYQRALSVFEKANDSFKKATVYMNLGSAYNHIGRVDSSRMYLEKAIMIFRAIDNQPNLGTCLGLYSYSILPEKRYTEALKFLNQGLAIARSPNSIQNIIDSKLMLSDILYLMGLTYYEMGHYNTSRKYFLSCSQLSDSLRLLERNTIVADFLSKIYGKSGQIDSSFYYYRLFKVRSDSLMKIQSINVVKLAEAQIGYEKEVNEKKIQLRYQQLLQRRNLIIFIGIGTILIALVLILIQRLRIEKQKKKQVEVEKRQAELEKQTADIQLESQQKELTLNVMGLIRKNELILDFSNRLIRIKEEMKDEDAGAEIIKLINTIQKSADDNVWEEFEFRFKQVHGNFYKRLIAICPDLTPNELKLCALLKLNLSNKEISELSGQRSATLEVARYRIRKKLGITNSQVNLVTFLSQI